MALKLMAECDGPECDVTEEVKGDANFPTSWLEIVVTRSRFISVSTGKFGFHTGQCLVAWATAQHTEWLSR